MNCCRLQFCDKWSIRRLEGCRERRWRGCCLLKIDLAVHVLLVGFLTVGCLVLGLGFQNGFAGTVVYCPVLAVYRIVSVEYRSRLLTVVPLVVMNNARVGQPSDRKCVHTKHKSERERMEQGPEVLHNPDVYPGYRWNFQKTRLTAKICIEAQLTHFFVKSASRKRVLLNYKVFSSCFSKIHSILFYLLTRNQ